MLYLLPGKGAGRDLKGPEAALVKRCVLQIDLNIHRAVGALEAVGIGHGGGRQLIGILAGIAPADLDDGILRFRRRISLFCRAGAER